METTTHAVDLEYDHEVREGSNNTSNSSCGQYHTDKYMHLALIAASCGLFSFLSALAVILIILVFKKNKVFIQRLILYLCIASALNSASIVLRYSRVAYKSSSPNIKNLCIAAAFIDQTTLWSQGIAYACVTLNLLLTVIFKTSRESIEIGYVIFIFVVPLLFNWIPFIQGSYGEAGAWCWIRVQNIEYNNKSEAIKCSVHKLGQYLKYGMWYGPYYIFLTILLLIYILIVIKLICNSRRWKGLYSMERQQQKEDMKSLVMPIVFYPLIFFILNLFPLINRVYETFHDPHYVLWMLHAIISPLQGGFIALVYVLDKDTIHRLNLREIKAYVTHRWTPVKDYPARRAITDSYQTLFPTKPEEDKINFGSDYGSFKETSGRAMEKDEQDNS